MMNRDMDLSLSRGLSEAAHLHPELELLFVVEGQAQVQFGTEHRTLGKEDVLLVNSSLSHSVSAHAGTILFHLRYAPQLLTQLLGGQAVYFQCDSVGDRSRPYGELRQLLREAVYQYVQQRKTDCLKFSALYRVLDCLMESYQVEPTTEAMEHLTDDEKLRQIFQYINQNYQYSVSLSELADRLYRSQSTLSRFFKRKTGVYFVDYVAQIRMNHAVRELLHTDKGITSVAVDCGFSSPSVFNRSFRDVFGMTPTEYRSRKREAERERQREEQALTDALREELRVRLSDQRLPVSGKISRTIDAGAGAPWEKPWTEAVNAGSFDSLNQAQTQRQLLQLRERLGFRYARLWSIFSPNMKLTSGRLGDPMNFERIDSVLDFLMAHELIPFLDFANRPDVAIGELDVAVFRHSDYIPFESQEAWENCLRELIWHLMDRYGAEKVECWRFEFAYNLLFAPESNFYQGAFDYTSAFCSAWRILKAELPHALVGGPMGNIGHDKTFVLNFLRSAKERGCIPDFVSFMLFPYQTTEQNGCVRNTLSPSEEVERDYLCAMEDLLTASGCEHTRLCITEWNNTVSTRNFLNDSAFRGAYFVRTLSELSQRTDLVIPWAATDLISSHYDVRGIANGGAGLLTRDGRHSQARPLRPPVPERAGGSAGGARGKLPPHH